MVRTKVTADEVLIHSSHKIRFYIMIVIIVIIIIINKYILWIPWIDLQILG